MDTAIQKPKQDRAEIAQRMEAIMSRWLFAPLRGKGRPKKSYNMGRPRVIDPSTVVLLEEAFAIGASVIEACSFAEISTSVYYDWLKINPDFVDRAKQLQANPVLRARKSVYEGMKYDGELALKFLERKVPDEFSLKAIVQHNVDFTGIALDRPKLIEQEPNDVQAP